MDLLKEAFSKIKEDINSLRDLLFSLKSEIDLLKNSYDSLNSVVSNLNANLPSLKDPITPKYIIQDPFFSLSSSTLQVPLSSTYLNTKITKPSISSKPSSLSYNSITFPLIKAFIPQPTLPAKFLSPSTSSLLSDLSLGQQTTQTNTLPLSESVVDSPTVIPTDNLQKQALEPPKPQNNSFSSGSWGVQTNRQADQQTGRQVDFPISNGLKASLSSLERVNELMGSLDEVKRDIRLKFKSLTPQEMLVFSTLYTLEDQGMDEVTYSILAKGVNLTESSIRDYILKLIHKGIPIEKRRLNNKKVIVFISKNLRNITNLSTILTLRDL